MRALLGVLLILAVALTAGVIGFQAGVASNIAAAGGVVWLGGGFPFFGLLFFLLFLGVVFFAVGGARRRAMGRGPWGGPGGPGGWSRGSGDRHAWVREMHRRLHEDDLPTAGGDPTAAGSGSTGGGPAAS